MSGRCTDIGNGGWKLRRGKLRLKDSSVGKNGVELQASGRGLCEYSVTVFQSRE